MRALEPRLTAPREIQYVARAGSRDSAGMETIAYCAAERPLTLSTSDSTFHRQHAVELAR